MTTCTCGRPLDEHDRHIRYGLPDPVLELPDREATAGTWLSHDTPDPTLTAMLTDEWDHETVLATLPS